MNEKHELVAFFGHFQLWHFRHYASPNGELYKWRDSTNSYILLFRILNLFAEENAVEDTIYYLSESLRKEAIDMDVFLKVSSQSFCCNIDHGIIIELFSQNRKLCRFNTTKNIESFLRNYSYDNYDTLSDIFHSSNSICMWLAKCFCYTTV